MLTENLYFFNVWIFIRHTLNLVPCQDLLENSYGREDPWFNTLNSLIFLELWFPSFRCVVLEFSTMSSRNTGVVMRSMSLLSGIRLEFVVEAEYKRHARTITAALGIMLEFSQVRVPSTCPWASWEPEKQTQDWWQGTVSSTSQPELNHSHTASDRL